MPQLVATYPASGLLSRRPQHCCKRWWLSAGMLAFIVRITVAQQTWYPVIPSPTSHPVTALSCLDPNTAVVVGFAGTILRTSNGGVGWDQRQPSLSNLRGVSFFKKSIGLAVGDAGTILVTKDGGNHWSVQVPPSGASLQHCALADSLHALAVGPGGVIIKTVNGGTTWTSQTSGTTADLNDVACVDTNVAVVVGAGGTVLVTLDGGATWASKPTNTTQPLRAVALQDANDWIAVGGAGTIVRSYNAGAAWFTSQMSTTTSAWLATVRFFGTDSGLVTGCPNVRLPSGAIGPGPAIVFRTTNGGTTWAETATTLTDSICSFCDMTHGFALDGFSQSTDGGAHWTGHTVTVGAGVFRCIAFGNKNTGIATIDGNVYRSVDNGATWTLAANLPLYIRAVTFADSLHAFAVGAGGLIYASSDGGVQWIAQSAGTTMDLFGVAFSDVNNGIAVGGHFLKLTGEPWPKSRRTIIHTTNGGVSWAVVLDDSLAALQSAAALDNQTSVCGGLVGQMLRSTDAAATWTTTLLTDRASIHGMSFVDANTGTAVGEYMHVAQTHDGGRTWSSRTVGSAGTIHLNAVSFSDALHGMAVGGVGMVLYTSDGGVGWNQQWLGSNSDLYGVTLFNADSAVAAGGDTRGAGNPAVIVRTLAARALPRFQCSRHAVDFGTVPLGGSRTDTVTLKNTGNAGLAITNADAANPVFRAVPYSVYLAPGDSCVVTVIFTPQDIQTQQGTIRFTYSGPGSFDSIVLTGRGIGGPVVSLGSALNFGFVRVGKSRTLPMIVRNLGDRTLHVVSMGSSDARFALKQSSLTLAAGDSTSVDVTFAPDSGRPRFSTIVIAHDGVTSPDSLFVSGYGAGPLAAPSTIAFAPTIIGGERTQRFFISNPSDKPFNVDTMLCDSRQFSVSPARTSVRLADTAGVTVAFHPDTSGVFAGMILVYHALVPDPDTVFVTGSSTGPVFSVDRRVLDFGTVAQSETDSVSVTNIGNAQLTMDIATDNVVFVAAPATLSLAPGASSTIRVTFTPRSSQRYSGLLQVSDNAATTPDTVRLTGSGSPSDVTSPNDAPIAPGSLDLYPNPSTGTTTISIRLHRGDAANVAVYSVLGEPVISHSFHASGSGDNLLPFDTRALTPGIYFVELSAGMMHTVRALVVSP